MDITEEQAEDIAFADIGETVTIQEETFTVKDKVDNYREYRWNAARLTVLEKDGILYGSLYDIALTEMQESGCLYNDPEIFTIKAKAVTTVEYERV